MHAERVAIGALLSPDSPRSRPEDPAHLRELVRLETPFEPILVHRSTMRVIDGMHRVRATEMRGGTDILVEYFDGSAAEAFVLSVQRNIRHGLPLTLAERKAAAARIIVSHPHWSDRAVAEHTGISAKTVARVRGCASADGPHSHTRVGRDGRARPLSSDEGRRSAAALLAADPGASLRKIARAAGVSASTVRDVRERVRHGRDPVPLRHRGARPAGSGAPPPVPTVADAVRLLMRDPSVRSKESGRLLLRMLRTTGIDQEEWRRVMNDLPVHCAPLVRTVALRRAEEWRAFAELVSGRPEAA
ncbi:helix-turn-helix domain-containing protein [Streptomyces sp. NPDC002536]